MGGTWSGLTGSGAHSAIVGDHKWEKWVNLASPRRRPARGWPSIPCPPPAPAGASAPPALR
eukprot:5860307-Pyramimonas_sp.AAC.4